MTSDDALKPTPLHVLHVELGARMVPFAGYEMPVQYSMGVLKEHLQTRMAAGLFDVSHMGQIIVVCGALVTIGFQLADPLYRMGVIGVAIWYGLAILYFAVYGRKSLVLSHEQDFAVKHRGGAHRRDLI